jgi:primosomal protein N' (replication factor Y)
MEVGGKKMIYHRHINRLKCHHCHDEKIPEQTCPDCDKVQK